ncbi:MAG: CoA-disulfide reductase [Deltaproteobacteria bacterium]|nr:MAG: CoA-disulfide reductase [Deltaproteobacteria bacterium]
MANDAKRILIVGGVAGGASCAARARRLCERCEIILFDRGPFVSFANCGLPYYVGDVIADESKLLVATPELFKKRFNIEVRTQTEVTAIDPQRRVIEFEELETGRTGTETYDALVLAPGARAVRPPIEGIDLPGIFVVRTIPDSRRIREAVEGASSAVVVGAGFIGLEMAENLARRGLEVTIIELADQVLPPLDREMARFIERHLRANGVRLRLASGVEAFERGPDGRLIVRSGGGDRMAADLAILAIGVRPETALAEQAGLAIGPRGGIEVDEHMRTSDERIWAVGDAVEVTDVVTGAVGPLPLAGPANRQGRIAAANVLRELGMCRSPAGESTFRGVQATAVCGVFGLTVAMTGASEKSLERAGITAYEKVYLHPGSHAGYFPGAKPIHMKLLFSTDDGRVLGAQAVGEEGAERRVDVIAMAIQMGASVFDLEEAELCYAPQFGAAKDPVNIAGMIAANRMRGDLALARWEELEETGALILDVRTEAEFERGHIPGSVNIPLEQLRSRLDELPGDREIWLVCGVGQRAYYATRALTQRGLSARVLPGGMQTYEVFS